MGTLLNNLFAAPRFAGPLFDHSAASLPSASSVMRSRNARASSDGSPSMEAPVAVMATTPAHQVTKTPSTTARTTVRALQVRQTMSLLTVTKFMETGCHNASGGLNVRQR